MTAHALAGDRERCLAAGMDDYVAKPISPLAVAQVLERWLETLRRRSAARSIESSPWLDPASMSARSGLAGEFIAHAKTGGPPVWDRVTLLNRSMQDPILAASVVSAFRADLPIQLDALDHALDADDRSMVERLVHSLKSAAANIGAEELRECAASAEADARADRLTEVRAALVALHRSAQRLLDALGADPFVTDSGQN
jgi:HPt (histidine-containing phosphotransfer) domain-containing protein